MDKDVVKQLVANPELFREPVFSKNSKRYDTPEQLMQALELAFDCQLDLFLVGGACPEIGVSPKGVVGLTLGYYPTYYTKRGWVLGGGMLTGMPSLARMALLRTIGHEAE